jgi:two-component system, OmpR family, alkaline phosphatase synthesis response regulator PhoP
MTKQEKILIIDDEPTLCQTLARILQRAGYEATTAENGQQGLAFLETTAFDLVYLDIRMPGLSGLEVLDWIHSTRPDIPVVLFTAQPDLNSAVEALRRGARDYLLKPLKPQAILDRTRTILAAQQREQRKKALEAQIQTLQRELQELETQTPELALPPQPLPADERYFKRGALILDLHTHRLTIGQQVISFPQTSFNYLLVLARHSPEVVSYQTLVAEAQGYQMEVRDAQELVKWHIHHIRQAIEPDLRSPTYLFNVRGTGYRLLAD